MSGTADLEFVVDAHLPRAMTADLRRVLGTCTVGRNHRGVYFDFPDPFSMLRIYNGERIRGEKRELLQLAIEYYATQES